MKVRLAYGTTGLDLEVDPAVTTVVEPLHHPGAADETAVLRAALRRPVAGPPGGRSERHALPRRFG
ncbi:hypothetical protein [Kitasatospora kifunensis]|uniref:Uncharacterized protein n=1 Tax=Kitasatospora kifunensis TaxID=58351 RepID=A0A7W7RB00_KITKI|nr:hypothetical protein [Kitasatospora kifunensis]MBB4928682.1 hypothetical protein [Kitasatospora kifunensis]